MDTEMTERSEASSGMRSDDFPIPSTTSSCDRAYLDYLMERQDYAASTIATGSGPPSNVTASHDHTASPSIANRFLPSDILEDKDNPAPSSAIDGTPVSNMNPLNHVIEQLYDAKLKVLGFLDEFLVVCNAFQTAIPNDQSAESSALLREKRGLILCFGEEQFKGALRLTRLSIEQLSLLLNSLELEAGNFCSNIIDHEDVENGYEEGARHEANSDYLREKGVVDAFVKAFNASQVQWWRRIDATIEAHARQE